MSEVNWDLAPEGADSLKMNEARIIRFFKGNLKFVGNKFVDGFNDHNDWRTIATRPQTKTVADAVEWAKGEWREGRKTIWRSKSSGELQWGDDVTDDTICTREQFEAYAKEQEAKQEGDKWTHTTSLGKCRVLIDTPDEHGYVVIEGECDGYSLVPPMVLKPIKPKLTGDAKKQLELYVQYRVDKYGDYAMKSDLADYLSKHEIIEGPTND